MKKLLTVLLLTVAVVHVALASSRVLRVGVMKDMAPFAYVDNGGNISGLSVEFWQRVAKQAGVKYKFYPMDISYDDAIKMVHQRKMDLFVGPISVTHDRLEMVSFTRPYFLNRVGLAVNRSELSFVHVMVATFGVGLLVMFVIFFALLFVFTVILWYLERGKNPKMSTNFFRGLPEAFWAMVTSFLRDLVYAPATQQARVLLTIWLILSVIFMSIITAVVTASLTHAIDKNQVKFTIPSDMIDEKIAIVKGSNLYDSLAKQYNLKDVRTDDFEQALNLLDKKQVEGVMGDYFTLKYAIRHNESFEHDLQMSQMIISNDEYAFPIRLGLRDVRRKLDRAITHLQKMGEASHVCSKNLGIRHANNCQL